MILQCQVKLTDENDQVTIQTNIHVFFFCSQIMTSFLLDSNFTYLLFAWGRSLLVLPSSIFLSSTFLIAPEMPWPISDLSKQFLSSSFLQNLQFVYHCEHWVLSGALCPLPPSWTALKVVAGPHSILVRIRKMCPFFQVLYFHLPEAVI
jgi:hypothetical protein